MKQGQVAAKCRRGRAAAASESGGGRIIPGAGMNGASRLKFAARRARDWQSGLQSLPDDELEEKWTTGQCE
jgi:hypothetical protein